MFNNILTTIAILLIGVVNFSGGESPWEGTYELMLRPGNPEYIDMLLAMGYTREKALKVTKTPVTMTVKENPDKSFTVYTVCVEGNNTVHIISGKEFQDKLPDGRPFKAIYTIDGNKIHGRRKIGDIEVKTEKETSEKGIKITRTVRGTSTNFYWKRISPINKHFY